MKVKYVSQRVLRQKEPQDESRKMMTLVECSTEAGVSRRFLEKEIYRGHLRAIKLSSRICRVRRSDWEIYLGDAATIPAPGEAENPNP